MKVKCLCLIVISLLIVSEELRAQQRLPVIDMHLHASAADSQGEPPLGMCVNPDQLLVWSQTEPWPAQRSRHQANPECRDIIFSPLTDDEMLSRVTQEMERYNVIGMLSGSQEYTDRWVERLPDRFIKGFQFRLGRETTTPEGLVSLFEAGHFRVFAEISNQYVGIAPSDERFMPYLAAAEQADIPVGIHVGVGPPGAPYYGMTRYRAAMHSPLTLEDALIEHAGLRIYVMHAGWPMLDDMLAVLWTHPQVYVDTGGIVFALPKPEFYRYLQSLVEAGFSQRILFGTDQMSWPELIGRSIELIEDAPFLTDQQKRDILYNNAARFLRLSEDEIQRHHSLN